MGHSIHDCFFNYFSVASSSIAFSNSKNTTFSGLTKVESLIFLGFLKAPLLLPYILSIIFSIIKYEFRSMEIDKTFIHLWVLSYLFGSLTLDCRLVRHFLILSPSALSLHIH